MNVTYSYTHCRFGVATRDVTPPVGIYARSWGAATHEVAEGVHRPFEATAAVFAPIDGDDADAGARRRRPRLVPVHAGRAPVPRDDPARDGPGRGGAARQHVAHARRRERQLAAGRQARRRADRALPRAPDRADHRGDPRGAGSAGAGLGDVRHRPLRARDEPGLLGRRGAALRRRLQPRRGRRRHAGRRAGHGPGRRAARDALQLRVPPDDARLGEPRAVAGLHRRRARGPGGRIRRSGALPPGRLGRARPARRLRRRHRRRRSQRPPARPRRRGRDREPAAARHALRLHGDPGIGRQPRHVGVRAVRARSGAGERAAGRARGHGRATPQGGPRGHRQPHGSRLRAGAGEGAAEALPQRGARRRPCLRDADLGLAARRRAARSRSPTSPTRCCRPSCDAASTARRCSCWA